MTKESAGRPRSDINVTPLVDVCLVLLIIFIVITPMLGNKDLALPEGQAPPVKKLDPKTQIHLAMRNDSDLFLDSRSVSRNELPGALSAAHREHPEKALVILADKGLEYRSVRELMNRARDAGYKGVSLIAEKEKKAGK